MTLGERIKELRKQRHMTQESLAAKMNVTKGTVSTWERNSRRPGFETLNELCDLFDVNLAYLIGQSDDPSSQRMTEEDQEKLALDAVSEALTENALKYARLDEYGRAAVESIILAEYRRCRAQQTLGDAAGYKVSIRIAPIEGKVE